jgi:hypothetical protein
MSKALAVQGSSAVGWPEPTNAILPRETFATGMAMLAGAQARSLDGPAVNAYWLALCEVDARDFADGVRLALQRERYLTPAAVFEACDEAQRERRRRESREQDERRHARRLEIEAESRTWPMPAPSFDELRRRVGALLWVGIHGNLAGKMALSGTPQNIAVHVDRWTRRYADEERLTELIREAAGPDATVTFRDEDGPVHAERLETQGEKP